MISMVWCGVMVLSVPNMIIRDINDAESPVRQPITRERREKNISQGFMKKLGKIGKIIIRHDDTTTLLCSAPCEDKFRW